MPREVVYKPQEKVKPIYTGGTLTPPKFLPTYYEWLSKKGEQINLMGFASDGTIVYTIPKGYTFFITSYSLFYDWKTDAIAGSGKIYFEVDGSWGFGFMFFDRLQSSTSNISLSLTIPLKILSEKVIKIQLTRIVYGSYGLTGFLVKNNDIPVF